MNRYVGPDYVNKLYNPVQLKKYKKRDISAIVQA